MNNSAALEWRSMDNIYLLLEIMIYVIVILCIGFCVAYIIVRGNKDIERVIIARNSILEDLARIEEMVEQNNRTLVRIIDRKKDDIKRRYQDARKE